MQQERHRARMIAQAAPAVIDQNVNFSKYCVVAQKRLDLRISKPSPCFFRYALSLKKLFVLLLSVGEK